MNDQAKISMNAAQRSALRKAITSNGAWKNYRESRALKIEELSTGQLLDAAYDLGISPDTYMSEIVPNDDKTVGAGAALASLIGQIAGQSLSREAIEAMVDARLNDALKAHAPVVRIECKGFDGQVRTVQGHKHCAFAEILEACSTRQVDGFVPNIWMPGPTGSGKSHLGQQLASALGLKFYMQGAVGHPMELLGYMDAAGKYHRTQLRDAYEYGGLILLDDFDGSDPNATVPLFALLSNGHGWFADNQLVPRHPDCIIIASANTYGHGATAEYVGRNKMDGAFMARFPVVIPIDYDNDLEIAFSGNAAFAKRVIQARKRASAAGLKILIHPRQSKAGAALIARGWTSDKAAERTYLAGLIPEHRRMVEGA